MEALQIHRQTLSSSHNFMNPLSRITPNISLSTPKFRVFCATSIHSTNTRDSIPAPTSTDTVLRSSGKARVRVSEAQYKENWLASLSCPPPDANERQGIRTDSADTNAGTSWVIGIDPDLSGALALLKTDDSGCSAQVFDSPHLQILVGDKLRKRLDAKSMVQLLRSFDAPIGTVAYLEQSMPYPKDGKQGWWSGGFGYGLWIGILVASGFAVVPVPSSLWKNEFKLAGNGSSKDDSRRVASTLFPSMSSLLKRKKDHDRRASRSSIDSCLWERTKNEVGIARTSRIDALLLANFPQDPTTAQLYSAVPIYNPSMAATALQAGHRHHRLVFGTMTKRASKKIEVVSNP